MSAGIEAAAEPVFFRPQLAGASSFCPNEPRSGHLHPYLRDDSYMLNLWFLRTSLAGILCFFFVSAAASAELVMVELKSCIYCVKFNREMGPQYEASALGKKLPLRRVNQKKWPADLKQVERPPFTPVFILVEDGREVGRFFGYTSPEAFKKSLSRLVK
jgi:hypothetical protein